MSFAEVLQQLAGGQTYQELGDRLTEIVLAVQETRKQGELTIRLKVKPNGEHGVIIAEEVKSKAPEAPRAETLFYVTAAGHLKRDDPRQEKLPLRQITATGQAPLRSVTEFTEGVTING